MNARSHATRRAVALVVAVGGAALVVAVHAVAVRAVAAPTAAVKSFEEGTAGRAFSIADLAKATGMGLDPAWATADDPQLRLNVRSLHGYGLPFSQSGPGGPESAQWLDGGTANEPGDVMVCADGRVSRIDATGAAMWSYTRADDAALVAPCWARLVSVGGRDLVLVADRGAARVFAVEYPGKGDVVWEYGLAGQPGSGVNRLLEPRSAEYVPEGRGGRATVLIADAGAARPRVIEVLWGDYRAGDAQTNGFTAQSIVWNGARVYSPGGGEEALQRPVCARRGAGGETLIVDSDAHRVVAVGESGAVTWQIGVRGSRGAAAGYLDRPAGAVYTPGGDAVIADAGNDRLLYARRSEYVADAGDPTHGYADGGIEWTYPSSGGQESLDGPGAVDCVTERRQSGTSYRGAVLVCDAARDRVLLIGAGGLTTSGATIDSRRLTCGMSAVKKFIALRWTADVPSGTTVTLRYRSDDGIWRPTTGAGIPVEGDGRVSLKGVAGRRLQYTVSALTSDRTVTPVVHDLTIVYERPSEERADNNDDDGDGTADMSDGTASGGGAGSGTGVGGSGSGSGTGAGSGDGPGGTGDDPDVTQRNDAAPGSGGYVPLPTTVVPPAGVGTAVSGTLVRVLKQEPEAAAGGGGAGGSPSPAPPPRRYWPYAAAALLVASLLVVPQIVARRQMRSLFESEHAASLDGWEP